MPNFIALKTCLFSAGEWVMGILTTQYTIRSLCLIRAIFGYMPIFKAVSAFNCWIIFYEVPCSLVFHSLKCIIFCIYFIHVCVWLIIFIERILFLRCNLSFFLFLFFDFLKGRLEIHISLEEVSTRYQNIGISSCIYGSNIALVLLLLSRITTLAILLQ